MNFDARNRDSKVFAFDHVAAGETNQAQMYEKAGIVRMVDHVVRGFHATVFAYG